jgi:hypothetical protein
MHVHDADQAAFFIRKRSANEVLHDAIPRSDDALFRQKMHQFTKDIKGLAANRCSLSGARRQVSPYRRIRVPITAKIKDQPLLLEACAFGNFRFCVVNSGEISVPQIRGVLFYVSKAKYEERMASLEVAKLQNKKYLGIEGVKSPKRGPLLSGQREIFIPLLLSEAREPVEGVNFVMLEDGKTLAGVAHRFSLSRMS